MGRAAEVAGEGVTAVEAVEAREEAAATGGAAVAVTVRGRRCAARRGKGYARLPPG